MKKIENNFAVTGFVGKDAEIRQFTKSPCKSANPDSKTLFTFGKTQINKPETIRKTPMKM